MPETAIGAPPQDRSPVSLTGHYTGEVWVRHNLSPRSLSTVTGRSLYRALWPLERSAARLLGVSLEASLVQRHRLLDQLVQQAIAEQPDLQVLEMAAGASARAGRMLGQFPQHHSLCYTEADLPAVVAHKRSLLPSLGLEDDRRYRLMPVNIRRTEGPLSPESLLSQFDGTRPVLVITEGLLNYFPLATVQDFMARLAQALQGFPRGRYLAELWPRLPDYPGIRARQGMLKLIEAVTRQTVPLHFRDDDDIARAMATAGFTRTKVLNPDSVEFLQPVPLMRAPALFRVLDGRVDGPRGLR
ncbi:MAG: class I SAM-dependent methyltransferase [Oleiphilaceae bacterium]|nr:class I SAM-dependent methyltransferase [Oleiphilaceae bacterium]